MSQGYQYQEKDEIQESKISAIVKATELIDKEIEELWKQDNGRESSMVPVLILGLERAKELIHRSCQ